MRSAERTDADAVTALTATLAVAGFVVALFGVYWDDAWHTDRGRDDLLSAPHLSLYAGVAVAVAVVLWWGWQRRAEGWRLVLSGPVGVAVVGAGVTLGSAPVDEWWHESFGRDAVLWSPPHLLAVVGTVALGSGVVLVAGRSFVTLNDRFGAALLVAAGAGVVGGWQVLVLEYDTDVAQFSPLWYLPVLAAGLSAAALTVQAALRDRVRWSAAWAGAAYTVAMIAVIAVLWLMGFSTPIVPAIIPAMVAADVTRRRRWPVVERSFVFVAVLFVVYVPYLRAMPGGVPPSVSEAAAGVALGVVAVAITVVIFDPQARWRRPAGPVAATTAMTVMTVIAVLFVSSSRPASAHDPGQGTELVAIALTSQVVDHRIDITAIPEEFVAVVEPVRVVARRAGRDIEGPLSTNGEAWVGHVQVDEDGRWFVYVEARRGEDRLEAWLPVVVGGDVTASKRTSLYLAPASDDAAVTQVLVGVILVALSVVIVGPVASTVRATFRAPASATRRAGA